MILYLPTGLQEEELLYSALARSCDALPPRTLRDLLAAAFGTRSIVATIDLPARLDEVGSRLLCLSGRQHPGRDLLLGHTLFPYYSAVVDAAVCERATSLMLGHGGGMVHGVLGVRASRVPAPSRMRYCPECVTVDRATRDCAWWRRAHQLPGVLVCPTHAAVLRVSPCRTTSGRDRLAYHSLDRSISAGDEHCVDLALAERRLVALLALARKSAELLATGSKGREPIGIAGLWRIRQADLHSAGFGRGARQIATSRLRDSVTRVFGDDLLATIGCHTTVDRSEDWVSRMARPPRRSMHPLYHVLVAVALEICANGQIVPCIRPRTIAKGTGKTSHASTERCLGVTALGVSRRVPVIGEPEWHQALVTLVGQDDRSLRSIARELGADPLTVQRHAHLLGVWRPGWALREKVLPASKATSKHADSLRDAKARWLALRKDHPHLGREEIRRQAPAAYALLRRRDREWLESHSPPMVTSRLPASRVDWGVRDIQVSAELEAAADGLLALQPTWRAVRPATIARAADRLALLQEHAQRMPLSAAVLARRSQDGVALAAVRLERAVSSWRFDGNSPPARSVLARAAGLNVKRVAQLNSDIERAIDTLSSNQSQSGS